MADIEKCTAIHKKPKFTLEEQRSKVQFSNRGRLEIHEVKVDGCVITQNTSCDYLVNVLERDESIFVELKGSDVDHAFEQLEHSHLALREHRKSKVIWIVSCQSCPLTSTEITVRKLKLQKTLDVRLHVKTSPVEWKLAVPE